MNILFLDIDGVLLPFGSYNDWYLAEATGNPNDFMCDCAERCVGIEEIKMFCETKNAQIVLISTWRYIFDPDDLWQFFSNNGLADYFHIEWVAKDDSAFRRDKLIDINKWLMRHMEIEKWWILDDQDQGVPEGHWIKTDPYRGYTGSIEIPDEM